MRISILIIALLSLHLHVHACMGASQYRLFPLGTKSGNTVAMAVHVDRGHLSFISPNTQDLSVQNLTAEQDAFSENLTAIVSLIEINSKQVIFYEEIIDTFNFLPPQEMDNRLNEMLQFLVDSHKKIKGFKAISTESLRFCNFSHSCELAKIEVQKDKRSIQIRTKNEFISPINIPLDTILTVHPFLEYLKDFTAEFTEKELVNYPINELLYINSVRYYKQGKKRWVVLHITQGELLYDYDNDHVVEDYNYNEGTNTSFSTIRESYFPEPIIGHANGFDWLFEVKK